VIYAVWSEGAWKRSTHKTRRVILGPFSVHMSGLVWVDKGIENVRYGHRGEDLYAVYLRKG
jgi:hypothetical protein